jgi:hypothetical protein
MTASKAEPLYRFYQERGYAITPLDLRNLCLNTRTAMSDNPLLNKMDALLKKHRGGPDQASTEDAPAPDALAPGTDRRHRARDDPSPPCRGLVGTTGPLQRPPLLRLSSPPGKTSQRRRPASNPKRPQPQSPTPWPSSC